MKSVLSVIAGLVVAVAFGVLVAAVVCPDEFRDNLPGWLYHQEPGPQVLLVVEPEASADLGQAVEESIRVIKRRLDDLGMRAVVGKQEADRILVRLPRSANVTRSIEILTRRGKLELRLIDQTMTVQQAMAEGSPAGSEILYEGSDKKLPYLVEKRVLVSGRDLVEAQANFDARTNEPVVNFRFNARGTRRFARATQENVGRPFAIVFDNQVLSAPVIREPILGGMGQISGSFTVEQAFVMATLLRAGELPGRLSVIEQRAPQ
jgi:protein-export membrane protein SecD